MSAPFRVGATTINSARGVWRNRAFELQSNHVVVLIVADGHLSTVGYTESQPVAL